MDTKKIQELLKIIEKYKKISEISIEEKHSKIHIKMHGSGVAPAVVQTSSVLPALSFPSSPTNSSIASETPAVATSDNKKYVKSPIVGTFYSKSSPDSPPFVKVGDKVQPNTVVCIIESMKVFNEVEAEISGVIKEMLLKDGSPVEHGQELFVIE